MLDSLYDLLQQIAHKPLASLGVIVNLILIESLLSVDNAAVLATMVLDLPRDQRTKALRYGLLGAYIFRGICLLFAAVLVSIWWFKPLGGLYLLYLAARYFFSRRKQLSHDINVQDELNVKKRNPIYLGTIGMFGPFWATVIVVEVMDVAFSIDNVIAANAYSKNLILVWAGVFIGILAMRFASQGFVKLLERYPFLERCAYIIIAVLGVKLSLTGITHYFPCTDFSDFMQGHLECMRHRGELIPEGAHEIVWGDLITSIAGIIIFVAPIITSRLFNWPKHRTVQDQ